MAHLDDSLVFWAFLALEERVAFALDMKALVRRFTKWTLC